MKLLVMSDSHRNKALVSEIVARNKDHVDAFVHLGDGIKEFLDVMEEYGCKEYYYIAGNHEEDSFLNISPDYKVIHINGHNILITHGNKFENKLDLLGVAHIAKINGADIALCGHTHTAADDMIHGIRVINPGALKYWRDGSPKYALLSIDKDIKVKFIEKGINYES